MDCGLESQVEGGPKKVNTAMSTQKAAVFAEMVLPRRPGLLRRLSRHRLAVGGIVLLLIVLAAAILAPWICPHDYRGVELCQSLLPPSHDHWLGTDIYGRDLLSRIIWGGRVSLMVAFFAVGVGLLIGGIVGAVTAYVGGIVDIVGMRLVEIFGAIPSLYLMLLLIGIFGSGTLMTIIAIGLTFWTGASRILRAEILSIKERDFVLAARVLGVKPFWLVVRHILPNALSPLIVQATLFSASAIIMEAGLSFLGLGVQPPTPSWGSILSEGRRELLVAPWVSTFPGFAIFFTVIGLNMVGDGLRDALDPRQIVGRV